MAWARAAQETCKVKKDPCYLWRPGAASQKRVSIPRRRRSRERGRASLSARSIGFMVFLPAYAATSQLLVPPDPIHAILNRVVFALTLVAIPLSVWCDWRGRKRIRGKILYFPGHAAVGRDLFSSVKQDG